MKAKTGKLFYFDVSRKKKTKTKEIAKRMFNF